MSRPGSIEQTNSEPGAGVRRESAFAGPSDSSAHVLPKVY